MRRLDGKVAIVTGAGSGFGEAIAMRFAAGGARAIVAEINEESGHRVSAAIESAGGTARFVRTDVSRAADVEAMVAGAVAAFGGLDVLVNNAGFAHRVMGLWDLSEEDYERFRRGPAPRCTTPPRARWPLRPAVSLARSRRSRFASNAVNPVAADTAFMKTALGTDSLPDEVRRQLLSTIPLGRLTEPSDVATAVLFLASDEAVFLTGVCLAVDGGRSISQISRSRRTISPPQVQAPRRSQGGIPANARSMRFSEAAIEGRAPALNAHSAAHLPLRKEP